MVRKIRDQNQTKTAYFYVALLTLAIGTTLVVTSLSIFPVNGQTMQEKCTPDQTGINVSKSNCFSNVPTSIGDNMTINGTTGH